MWKFLKRNYLNIFFVISLVIISLFIAYRNFTPGTWLLGWDNLVPELNFKLNLERSLSAVWQEYQGVGLLGGMAHAADLVRVILLKGFSYFIPLMYLRYLWTFLMLALGPIGIYFLVKQFVNKDDKNGFLVDIASFTSAIFYIFNLATVQTFFTPFETFTTFYGFLPWFLFLVVKYLREGNKKYLLIFALVSLLGASSFYVQTLFVVYAIFLLLLGLEAIIRYKKAGFIRFLKIILLAIFINAFWLGPAAHFTYTGASIVSSSHINSIATPETQLMNKARSDFESVATLKGYWFDYYDWNSAGQYKLLYQDWIDYDANPYVGQVSITLFFLSAAGLIIFWFKPKNKFGLSFTFLFAVSFLMLSGADLSGIPILNEAFRNTFTKWSNAAALVYSVGLGIFVYSVSSFVKNKLKYIPAFILSVGIIGGSILTTEPILNGKLISKSMEVNLPSYYFDVISYFKNIDPSARIAAFPVTDFWGWQFNTWGYRGSGFIWYGIKQPVLSRTFDVWSPFNEQFYNEINYVLNWGNSDDLKRIFEKYQVSYILFDNSIVEIGNPESLTDLTKEKEFLESSGFITKAQTFGEITVYKVNLTDNNNFISAPSTDFSGPLYNTHDTGQVAVTENFPDSQGYEMAKNCNLDGNGTVIKEKRDGGNYYEAENDGISCDYFYYPTLNYSKAYRLQITGKNISGRSLRFYLYNVKDKKVIVDALLPAGNFDETFVILPTGGVKETGGYTLNVETRAFGKVKSENEITKIEFYNLSFEKTQPVAIANNIQILRVKKYETWGYSVETKGEGLLALGQGYDNGWVAFQIKDNKPRFLNHLKLNSWANGWTVPATTNNQQSVIYILFWPQILEWGGILIGGITLLVLIIA